MTKYDEMMQIVAQSSITVYDELNATNSVAAMEEFLANSDMRQPNFEYGNLDLGRIRGNLERLDQVRREVEELMTTKDNLSQSQFETLSLALNDAEDRNQLINSLVNRLDEDYLALNRVLYGEPQCETFEDLLSEKFVKVKASSTWFTAQDHEMFAQLVLDFPGALSSKTCKIRFKPQKQTVKSFGEMLYVFYADLTNHVPKRDDVFSPAEVVTILNNIVREEFDSSYQAVLIPDGTSLSVDEITKTIKVPGKRSKGDLNYQDLIALVVGHELGVHALRSMVYESCPTAIMSQGLPNSSLFDEGLAKCVEQALSGKYVEAGVDHYLAIGMANLYHYDFRKVYEVMLALKMLTSLKPNESTDDRARRYQKEQKAVFNCVRRCFRGLGKLPFNKDLIYFNGASTVWQFIEKHINQPEWLFEVLFLSGKSNVLLPEHQAVIYECQRSWQCDTTLSGDLEQPWYNEAS